MGPRPEPPFALNVFGWLMNSIVPAVIPPPPPAPETYFALQSPIRAYDSRLAEGVIPSGGSRVVKVAGITVNGINVPADATSIVANVTAVDSSEAGYLTVFPAGQAAPAISTHNFGKGENFANTVVMGVSSGNIAVLNQFYNNGAGGTQVLVDVVGYSRSIAGGGHLRTLAPVRVLDSRVGTGTSKEPFHARAARDLTIVGQPGVPTNVQAVVLNMTVANATNTGSFVTVWPSGEPQPNVSNLNIIAGVTRPNLVVARVGQQRPDLDRERQRRHRHPCGHRGLLRADRDVGGDPRQADADPRVGHPYDQLTLHGRPDSSDHDPRPAGSSVERQDGNPQDHGR